MVEKLKGGEFMYKMELLNNINYSVKYIQEIPQSSIAEYEQFCEWLNDKYKDDKRKINENNLEYFDSSLNKIKILLEGINKNIKSIEKIINLNKIDFDNKEHFIELLEDMKDEYEFLTDTDSTDYEHFNRIMSWYRLTPDYLDSSIKHLANNKVDLKGIDFDEVLTSEQYSVKIIEDEL
ncbi:TPA: hypothetical protein KOW58_003871 [Clostridioides difficile]|nr:hypothetical protein [Clostridioides difficile]